MADRRAFLVALLAPSGCNRPERPQATGNADPAASRPTTASVARTPGAEATPSVPRVAMLSFSSPNAVSPSGPPVADSLRDRLARLGRVDGRTIVLDERYAKGDPQRIERLAQDIVESKPDIIVAIGALATGAARQATATIPIVMVHAGNPVEAGFAASLSHPGGNVTGTTSMAQDLGHKQVELLGQLVPRLRRLGVLTNPTNVGSPKTLVNVREAALRYGIDVTVAEVTRREEFDAAFARLKAARTDALYVAIDSVIFVNAAAVLEFTAANRLPASFDVGGRELVRRGALMSYGPVLTTHFAIAAEYVDKILRGARPGDLPVQQPTEFALFINSKTAAALGIAIPQSLLQRADEIVG